MIDDRVALHLDDMKSAAIEAVSFLDGVGEVEFLASAQLQKACTMCLVIIAEASGRIEQIAPDFISSHLDWPWREIRGMRNIIVHDYAKVQLPRVWLTVKVALPALLAKIESLGELDPRLWPRQ